MKKRIILICACIAEPLCHVLGIPHPEGLQMMALSYINEEL